MSSPLPEPQTEQSEPKPTTRWQAYKQHFTLELVGFTLITMAICVGPAILLALQGHAKHGSWVVAPTSVLLFTLVLWRLARSYLPTQGLAQTEQNPEYHIESAGGWLSVAVTFLVTSILIN